MKTTNIAISALEPDWVREKHIPGQRSSGKKLLASIRDYQRRGPLLRRVAVARHIFWSAVTGADIPLTCQIGGGLLIPHPNGIVIHPGARVGPNCLIFQQVTIGVSGDGLPTIGGHVDIGAGAKIVGAVTVGDHAVIGANAVVVHDVPPGAVVAGVPARIIRRGDQQTDWASPSSLDINS